jgi:hypothetical protein
MELREILWVVPISATPIGELRAGIPTAYFVYDFPWYYAFLFSVGIERKRAFLYITLGVLLAGAIVTVLCVTGNEAVLWLRGE